MSRASLNNFVGLFGRQAPIGLDVPQWVTIYVPDWKKEWSQPRMDFLAGLVEGIAIVGAVGCSVIFNVEASEWNRAGLNDVQERLGDFVRRARPYFEVVASNLAGARQNFEDICGGRLLVTTNGWAPEMPDIFAGIETIVVDYKTTMISKTSHPRELMAEALEAVANPAVRELPHWAEPWSATLLDTTLGLLALNLLAKPGRFAGDTFFLASDYLDETVAQAFNDRTLRARWRKKPKTVNKETSNA